jgi:hypothetical protein
MKNKLIGILIVLMLVLIFSLGSITIAEKTSKISYNSEKSIKHVSNDEYDLVVTAGPIENLLDIIEIEWIEGDPELIKEIEELLDPTYSLKNIGVNVLECSNLSFTITYNWSFRFRPLYRFSFFTTFINENRMFLSYLFNSIPYLGRSHTTTIEGFNGELMVIRYLRPIKIINSIGEFNFWGDFEEVTITK